MTNVEELVQEKSKAELVEAAEEYGLDTEGNKSDIAERIVYFEATGGAPPDDSDDEVVEQTVDDVVEEPAPAGKPENLTDTGDDVLVKYDGNARTFELYGYRFGRKHPFKAVPKEDADKILEGPRGNQFRAATSSQVESFYS